jgi:hypothetical protein
VTASPDLITVDFVETIYGAEVEAGRAGDLITVASDVVREYCRTDWTDATAPAAIRLLVAQMVGDAFANVPADEAAVKAEQIGDYRVEYARASQVALSTKPYEDVLDRYRVRGYSISTPIAFDGVVDDEEDEDAV